MKIKLYRCLMTKLLVSNSLRTLSIGVFVGMTLPGAWLLFGSKRYVEQPGQWIRWFKFQLCQQCFCSEWNEDVAIQLACHQLR